MIFNIIGGGTGTNTGAALTVNAPAGVTVTVSKDGKSKNKTANSSGIAVFKGLSTGEWTVTITDGEKTASKPVTIIADFNKSITFFAATIHVTYPAGSICTATDGVTTLTAPDTSGTWECIVPNAGTWVVSCTDGTLNRQTDISITTDGQSESAVLQYKLYLYNYGDQCTDVTGGWTNSGYTGGGGFGYNYSFLNDSIALYFKAGAYFGGCGTENKIDLSNYNTLCAIVTTNANFQLKAVSSKSGADGNSIAISSITSCTKETVRVTITDIDTSAYILAKECDGTAYVYSVWLEV